jgi:hypothetical protein
MSLKFWERHAEEMRRARLLQASAILLASPEISTAYNAVDIALRLEQKLDERLKEEKSKESK